MKEKIGSLYPGLNGAKSGVGTYSTVFLLRRSIFVVITFALFQFPEIQVLSMLCLTLLYISYIANMHFFDGRGNKTLEVFNESFFVLLQYNLVVLTGVVDYEDIRTLAGYLVISLTGLLLAINLIIIIAVGIRGLIHKCYLRR